jgi:hypothetical protein
MSVEALGLRYVPFEGPEWVLVGVAIATIALVTWESWQARIGNDRPVLKVAVGIMLSFVGGMAAERGIGFFRSGASAHVWVSEVLAGLVSLALSITYFTRRKARPGPSSIIEWLNERNKPPLMFDKKNN